LQSSFGNALYHYSPSLRVFLTKEAFTDRHGQVLMGGRDPRLQAVTARKTAKGGSSVTRLLQATFEIIAGHF
jgi:hypothetical protein